MIQIETSDAVLTATMMRAPHNALDDDFCAALERVLDAAQAQGSVVVHLRSGVQNFCGGADPARIAAWLGPDGAHAAARDARRWDRLFGRFETSEAVIVAEIAGGVLGAGLGLALAADLRLAGEDASFGAPEARFGLLPLGGAMARLTKTAGAQTARRLLFSGEIVSAEEALRLRIVDRVTPSDELTARAKTLAERISVQSPAALQEVRHLLDAGAMGVEEEAAATQRLLATSDTRQRCARLLERLASQGSGL